VAGKVDDLGAGGLRHLDVTGSGHAGQLADHGGRIGDVLEHVGTDGVVEGAVGEGHVVGRGVEQRPRDAGGIGT